jgi:hypothetical protein
VMLSVSDRSSCRYEALCETILLNASLGLIPTVHPVSGGIYCDSCSPQEFVETAANQSARFIAAATQPGTPEAEKVAGVLLAAADKLTAGFLHRFAAQVRAAHRLRPPLFNSSGIGQNICSSV